MNVCVLSGVQDEDMPLVQVGVFIQKATPFLEEFLERLTSMNYPTSRLRLFIHNNVGCQQAPPLTSGPSPLTPDLWPPCRWSTTSATSSASGSAAAPSSWTSSWWGQRRTCPRARPGTWRREWSLWGRGRGRGLF